jgi:hypothetical protein
MVVSELGYREVYLRESEGRLSKKQSELLGWYPTRDTKITLFGNYRNALYGGRFINRSAEAMKEHREIIYASGGGIEHSRSHGTDPSGAKMNHGDRVTADALLSLVMMGSRHHKPPPEPKQLQESIGFRRERAEELARKAREW